MIPVKNRVLLNMQPGDLRLVLAESAIRPPMPRYNEELAWESHT